ncbi:FecR family protein [Mucilaginibacter angelicae]|uniref:FecR family protein n=1 Tax=Mucilaginibacter angelicae TaxID=869718 RepID=A0ABV6L5R0_9SPHI
MDQQTILELIRKHADNTATPAERDALMSWYREKGYRDVTYPDTEDAVEARMLERLLHRVPHRKTYPIKIIAIAASVLFALGFGILYHEYLAGNKATTGVTAQNNSIKPGTNKAVLTLSNGSKVELNQAGKGTIAYQKGMQVVKSANGQVVYSLANHTGHPEASSSMGEPSFNTVETPRGGQFEIVLPDGSKVWLNAASSIRFPVSFVSLKERHVELEGEAYFEVTHNTSQPFRVSSGKQVVEVLGTHFDIMSYDQIRGIKTTLLQGSVKVSGDAGKAVLKPGQQSTFSAGGPIAVSAANIEQVVAWKNGYFRFEDERLEDIISTISRWYDFDAVFEDETLKDEKFGAFTARFSDINTLLNIISRTGNVKFVLQGKNIRIMRKQ